MESQTSAGLIEHFGSLEDPRIDRTKRHKLIDIVVIAICGAICGADDWVSIEAFGNAKREWLAEFLELSNGIPSHDTFGRVFSRLDPEQFQSCFLSWVQAVFVPYGGYPYETISLGGTPRGEVTDGQVIAVDGKQVRGSYDHAAGKGAIQMVSAWATENQLVLGQVKVDEKSNEIPAIPALLKLLDISGCIVTVDAMGCQKAIAQQIVDGGADYVLAVKANQGQLFQELTDLFAYAEVINFQPVVSDFHETFSRGHGRFEKRRCWAIADPDFLFSLRDRDQWPQLHTVVKVEAERTVGQETTVETRFFIASLPHDAARLLAAVRGHWGIENRRHWVLDVACGEDHSRVRKDHAPHNLAILRHIALNLLKHERSAKLGVKNKRLRAGWDPDYLLKVLTAGKAK
ncbi:MAG TPA: ISAs1 family transposase [Chloroflexi bacterium]|nr:ISAs1 family transposase [Chloroflexota bacterium]